MSEVSTPVRQPTVQEMLHLWKKCENRMKKELLEKSFTLRTNNLSGVHCESFEYRSVNLRRTHNITLPIYNPRSDPHLRYFYAQQRKQQQQQQQQQHSPARKSDEEDAGTPRSPRTPREEAEKPVIDTALSTEHVLELKKLFLEWSVSENVQTCACSRCPVRAAGVDHEIRHFIMTQELNVHNIVCKGVAITNSHCRLHEHLTHRTPSQELLYDWLALLDGLIVLEWPTFLLLCTANLHHDFITVSRIRSACEGFLQRKPVCSEADYHELLAFLLFNIPAAAASCRTSLSTGARMTSFFQCGDFYRARHTCSFADTLFSLLPRRAQFYLAKANARGGWMNVNFCGHCGVTGLPETDANTNRPRTAPHPPAQMRLMDRQHGAPIHRTIIELQRQRARLRHHAWA